MEESESEPTEIEGFDEWTAEFVDVLIRAEEEALATQLPQNHHPPLPQNRAPLPCDVSYSPPRELSQRTSEISFTGGVPDCFDSFAPRETLLAKQENDRLKKELNHVSKEFNLVTKQLNDLEQEVLELRKEKFKKEEELKVLHSRIEVKDAELHHTKNTETDCTVPSPAAHGIPVVYGNASSSESQLAAGQNVGIQTDKITEASTSAAQNCGSEKLFSLWKSDAGKLGRVLVGELFVTCEADFHVLFGYLNSSQDDSSMALSNQLCHTQPIEAAKVSHLFSVLTKISNDTLRLKDLLEVLVDLCSLKNVVIIHSSLCVLHKILSNSFSMEKEFGKRENVMVEDTKSDINGCGNFEEERLCFAHIAEMLKQGQISRGLELSNVETPGRVPFFNRSFGASISGLHWVSLFENMCLISLRNNEEQIRQETLAIMNLILMRQNAYTERDKFVGELVFRSLSQLLRREAGFPVQDRAVHTLYLLCNCPKVIAMLCSTLKEDGEHACSEDINNRSILTFQGLNEILNGLADCVAHYGSSTAEEMKLRRNTIAFLAFLGSSRKPGFDILLNHSLPKGSNFLAIILQSLKSDLDLQASKPAHKSDIVQEQNLLIREALILLNRLASHPQYSVPVLQALTNTRDMASTAVDVANRLTQKGMLLWQNGSTTKQQIRESEIIDLARVFKKRVFTFFGDSIS